MLEDERKKRPAFLFYPGDWQRDTALRSCSIAARGLWIELLAFMHDGAPYGHLCVANRSIDVSTLGRMVGASKRQVTKLLRELEAAGVFSRTQDGTIYSRRMIRDEEIRAKRAAGGMLGGNPALMKVRSKVNHPANLSPTPAVAVALASAAEQHADDSLRSSSGASAEEKSREDGITKKQPTKIQFRKIATANGTKPHPAADRATQPERVSDTLHSFVDKPKAPKDPLDAARGRIMAELREHAWLADVPPANTDHNREGQIVGQMLAYCTETDIKLAIRGGRKLLRDRPFSVRILLVRGFFARAREASYEKRLRPLPPDVRAAIGEGVTG